MFEHGAGCTAKELVEQGPVIVEERSKQMGHREGDMLLLAIRQNMALLGNPLFGAFEAAGTAIFSTQRSCHSSTGLLSMKRFHPSSYWNSNLAGLGICME
nr:hypothetical protein [Providencia sp. PROV197]